MEKENMVGFRIRLYDVGNPQELWKKLKPKNCINSIWIPQTIGDQIWMWFEFKNTFDKDEYINSLKPLQILNEWTEANNGTLTDKEEWVEFDPKKHFMHNEEHLTQKEIDHWTKLSLLKKH